MNETMSEKRISKNEFLSFVRHAHLLVSPEEGVMVPMGRGIAIEPGHGYDFFLKESENGQFATMKEGNKLKLMVFSLFDKREDES